MTDPPTDPMERLRFMAAAVKPGAVHLFRSRYETLCGAAAKSVRTTRKVRQASCEACLDVLSAARTKRAMEQHAELLRRIQAAGGLELPPLEIREDATDAERAVAAVSELQKLADKEG